MDETTPRVKSRLAVQALIRRCGVEAIPAMVVHHGDDDAGAILLKLNRGAEGCELFAQIRDGDGRAAWLRVGGGRIDEAAADSYVARQRDIDCDLWVVEIEDRAGRLPLVEPVLTG